MPDDDKRRTGQSQPADEQRKVPIRKDERGVLIEDEKQRQSVMQDDPTPFDTTPKTPKTGTKDEKSE